MSPFAMPFFALASLLSNDREARTRQYRGLFAAGCGWWPRTRAARGCGDRRVVAEIVGMVREVGVDPSSWIWVHAHAVKESGALRAAAEAGGWVTLDGLGEGNAAHILGLLGQALISHVGEVLDPAGGSRQIHYLMTDFTPRLERSGFTPVEVRDLTVANPARALAVRGLAAE
jgi:predicted metal-dependent phosphotriesterase family hydrolase